MHLTASVEDTVIQDLRAEPEHALALAPLAGTEYCRHGAARRLAPQRRAGGGRAGVEEALGWQEPTPRGCTRPLPCSLNVAYTTYVDPRKAGPSLVLQVQARRLRHLLPMARAACMSHPLLCCACAGCPQGCQPLPPLQNPRILILFRFVSDVMQAVEIIFAAIRRTKEQAAGVDQLLHAEPAAAPASPSPAAPPRQQAKPLELVVQLSNVGLLMPTSSTSKRVFSGSLDFIKLAMPGAGARARLRLRALCLWASLPACLAPPSQRLFSPCPSWHHGRVSCAAGDVMPVEVLQDCLLPTIEDMARESVLRCVCLVAAACGGGSGLAGDM